jgi:hypothetical protein
MKIISRKVNDDMEAFKMAGFIEANGGSVFSITFDGMYRIHRAMADTARFIVWGKYEDTNLPDKVDADFGKWLNSLTPQKSYSQ